MTTTTQAPTITILDSYVDQDTNIEYAIYSLPRRRFPFGFRVRDLDADANYHVCLFKTLPEAQAKLDLAVAFFSR